MRAAAGVVGLVLLAGAGAASAQPAGDAARAEALNREGKERMRVLDLEGAAGKFRQAIGLEPDPRYYFNLCFTLEKLERLAEARAACDVTEKDPGAQAALRDKARELIARIDARGRAGGKPETGAPGPETLADGEVVKPQPQTQTPTTTPTMTPVAGPGGPAMAASGPAITAPTATAAPSQQTVAAPAPPAGPLLRPLGIGARAGVSFANLKSEGSSGDGRNGATAALMVLLRFHPALSAQVEAAYAQKGTEFDGDGVTTMDVKIKLAYLEVPVLLRVAPPGHQVRPFGVFGVGIGKLIDAELVTRLDVEQQEDDLGLGNLDVAAVLGGGLEIPAGSGMLAFEARYWMGLADIDESDGVTVKNRSFTLSAGFIY